MDFKRLRSALFPNRKNVPNNSTRAGDPSTTVLVLNAALGIPMTVPAEQYQGGPDSEMYLFEYNYRDRRKSVEGVSAVANLPRAQNLDFSSKTLLLAVKGLHPSGDQLLSLAREFRCCHLFFELWNGLNEVVALARARIENLYFLPVTTALRHVSSSSVPDHPNKKVFVSLGGDDDLDLIREVIGRCRALHFFVPTVSWSKTGSDKSFFEVSIPAANVTSVDCSVVLKRSDLAFSPEYVAAYASCDTVLIANTKDKLHQLRGGTRFADALYARKHIVTTENPMCQLLMADHERTCLVAEHDAEAIATHLMRIRNGGFQVAKGVYEQMRHLTLDANKLAWMINAGQFPEVARQSPFARGEDLLDRAWESFFHRGRTLLERERRELSLRARSNTAPGDEVPALGPPRHRQTNR